MRAMLAALGLVCGGASVGAQGQRSADVSDAIVRANLAELYEAAALEPGDVTVRLHLAGYLRLVGLEAESDEVLRELAASGADVDVLEGEGRGVCAERQGNSVGPDIIVGDINGTTNWGKFEAAPGDWRYAFSAGGTACNLGDAPVEYLWSAGMQNWHPVMGSAMYRIHGNVLRQLGQGWLKHRYFALSQNLCEPGCISTNGSALGVNCSDPYTSSRAGQQSNMGPKYQTNAATGHYLFPFGSTLAPVQNLLSRRVQVRLGDLNPAHWPGAIYFMDHVYVQWQDAQAENKHNNNSWRRLNVPYNDGGTPEDASDDVVGNVTFNGSTRRMQTPIDAWRFYVPAVEAVDVIVPSDSNIQIDGTPGEVHWSGRFHVGSYAADNGDGTWTYHYAVFNQNSHRSARVFRVGVPSTVAVTGAGFADVDYHSGDGGGSVNFDGTDWSYARGQNDVSWSAPTFDENENANALRWGTTYSFWFTADAPPAEAGGLLGLFRPGPDADPSFRVVGPACLLAWDLDGDGYVGFADLNAVLSAFGAGYGFEELNDLLGQFGARCE